MKFFLALISLSIFLPLLFASHDARLEKLQDFFSKSKSDVLNGETEVENYEILQNIITEMNEIFNKENETSLNMTRLNFLQNKAALKKLIANKERTDQIIDSDLQSELDAQLKKEEEEKNKKEANDTYFLENRHLQFADSEDELDDPEYQKKLEEMQRQASIDEKIAQQCTTSFISSIPTSFCYKKNSGDGNLAKCPSSYTYQRLLIVDRCVASQCKSGFRKGTVFSTTCFEVCPSGYADHPLSCFKNLFRWFFKSTYDLTTFALSDPRAYCDYGFYKNEKYCYRDCGLKNMVNCRTDICSITYSACSDGLKNMVKDFFLGLGKIFLNIFTFGISGILISNHNKGKMTDAVNKAGKAAMLTAWKNVKEWINRIPRENLVNQMATDALSKIAAEDKPYVNADIVTNRCGTVRDLLFAGIAETSEPSFEWTEFKFADVRDAIKKCGEAGSTVLCQKLVNQQKNKWDGSGFFTFAEAFNQDKCQV